MANDTLKLTPRKGVFGCGIYDAGDTEKCYTRLFVTDSGRVLPVNHRALSEDDLLDVYRWGWEDALISKGLATEADYGEEEIVTPPSQKEKP